jgi:hypothetical protein
MAAHPGGKIGTFLGRVPSGKEHPTSYPIKRYAQIRSFLR